MNFKEGHLQNVFLQTVNIYAAAAAAVTVRYSDITQ
jgi:hypothetical protein